jgi:microcystin-dependent protein
MATVQITEAPKPPVVIIAAPYAPAGPIIAGTSSSENTIGIAGEQTFEMDQVGLGFVPGLRIRASVATDPVNSWMEGVVTDFDVASNELKFISDLSKGVGMYDTWNINVAGEKGQKGDRGLTGVQGPPGPAPLDSPVFVGTPQAPTQEPSRNDKTLATTEYVTLALTSKANINAPTFTGIPSAVTAPAGTNTTQIATTQFVKNAIDNLGAVGGYALLASPIFTGNPQAPTPAPGDNDTSISTTAFVAAAINTAVGVLKGTVTAAYDTLGELEAGIGALNTALALKAPLASPALTGTPTAPTPANADSSTALATTQFVKNVVTVSGGGNVSNSGTPTAGQLAVWTSSNLIEGKAAGTVGLAPLADPIFSGDVRVPTAAPGDNDLTAASTAFVTAAIQAAIAAAVWSTGDVKATLKTVADPGWVLMNDGTIGDATSAATTRANADCQTLFTLVWLNIPDSICPVTPGGRGANAAADWTAHKRIALPKTLGRALAAAGTGAGLSARALGASFGEETHTQTVAEMPVHNHAVSDPGHVHSVYCQYHIPIQDTGQAYDPADMGSTFNCVRWGGAIAAGAGSAGAWMATISQTGISIQNAGSGSPFNVIQPTTFMNFMVKL